MKPLIKIFFYFFCSLFLGVLLAPWIYQLVQILPTTGGGVISNLIASIQQMPFHRYLSRTVQVIAIVLLVPTIRWLNIHYLSELSLYKNVFAFADFIFGFLAALIPLWILECFFIWRGWYRITDGFTIMYLLRITGTAITVAFFEEFFFRGLLLGLSRRFLTNITAIIFNAFLFAGVHFLNIPHGEKEIVSWSSGLSVIMQFSLPNNCLLLGAFANLFLLGVILAWVTLRTRSLWLAIGLHTAWIFGQQSFNKLACYNIDPPNALMPWLGLPQVYGMVPVGMLTLLPLCTTSVFLLLWLIKRRSSLFF